MDEEKKIGSQTVTFLWRGIQLLEDEVLKKLKNVKRYVAENGNKDLDPHYVVEEFLFENLASLVNIFLLLLYSYKLRDIALSRKLGTHVA